MANRWTIWRQARFVGLYAIVALMLFLPGCLHAQAKGTVSQNPINPLGLSPIRIVNYPRPVNWGYHGNKSFEKLFTTFLQDWSFTLVSASYQFLNERSRVGGVSLDSDSTVIDLAATNNSYLHTCLDFSYTYSYASGSTPAGTTQTADQHVGSLRLLQPIYPFPPEFDTLSTNNKTDEVALILSANYGASLSCTQTPRLPSSSGSAYTFLGGALLDYQHGWFPNRQSAKPPCEPNSSQDYPNLLFEFSSGIQFNTIRFDSSERSSTVTSSGRQLTYQDIACLTYSFCDRFGFLVAAELDTPLYSDPLRGSQPYYANIAVFTAGLTYNIYLRNQADLGKYAGPPWNLSHWSLSLLYSYIAFDPLTETNKLQLQISYAF